MLSSNNLDISTVRPAVFLLFNYYKALCTVPTSAVVRTIPVIVYMSVLNLFLLLWYYQKCLMPYQLRTKLNMYTKYLILHIIEVHTYFKVNNNHEPGVLEKLSDYFFFKQILLTDRN